MTALLLAAAILQTPSDANAHFQKIQAVEGPAFDAAKYEKDKDAYVKEYEAAMRKSDEERNRLILAFYRAYPEDARLPDLMVQRWLSSFNAGAKPDDLAKDIEAVNKSAKSKEMKAAATYSKAIVTSGQEGFDWAKTANAFRTDHKASKYYEQLLTRASFEAPPAQKRAIVELFVKDFPEHRFNAMMKGQLRQMDAVGKPFELAFDDAITGKKVDIKDYRGKVVMIDWWATWCGPCVAELPHVKEVYKKYKDQGFEIIGISLDQPEDKGGLGALKEFVAKNDMPWPQYYMGKGWDSEFSSSWGIMSIPNVFLIDKEGILRQVEVTDLEPSVQKLLKD